jgi:hypothetical protein
MTFVNLKCLTMTLGAEQTSMGEYIERIGALTEAKADYACPCIQYCKEGSRVGSSLIPIRVAKVDTTR